MTTDTTTVRQDDAVDVGARVHPWDLRARGRHRRPRPRKVLLAAGGLAVAAGVLSLVRLAPDYGGGGPDRSEAGPHADADSGGSAGTSATAGAGAAAAAPVAAPSAAVPLGLS
ncbi:hypothetical protein C1I97_38885, partial [Streptomyces sp. NTH33]